MKRITIALGFVLLFFISYGQVVTAEEATEEIEAIFERLDRNLITTGILIDRVPNQNSNLGDYDGSCRECVVEPKKFQQFLLDLKTSVFTGNKYLDNVQENYQTYLSENKAIPIQISNILYNKFKSSALDSNYLDTSEGVFDEGINRSSSPYDTKRFVGLCIPDAYYANGITFTLNQDFYLSNDGGTIENIEIDFGDGVGYRSLAFNQSVSPDYKNITGNFVQISLRLTIDHLIYYGKTTVSFITCGNTSIPPPVSPPWANSSQFQYGNLVANETNGSNYAVGNVYVYYRPNPAFGTENQFKKPLIVVEGIDFAFYSQQNAANYQMGSFGWCALWGGSSSYSQLAKMPQLLNDYHLKGYDIIMLDFKDGAKDIKENAFLLQALIEKINQNKTADAEPNVIMGASMGAIVARYALADMEKDGKSHCTRLYISFDGPHQGANIPLGVQHSIFFNAINPGMPNAGALQFLDKALARTATKQLLKEQFISTWGAVHTQFFADLNSLGYPTQCKNVAIVSGSGEGTNQGYLGGAQIVDYNYSFLGIVVGRNNIWSLPGRSSDRLIFHGLVPFILPGSIGFSIESKQYAPSNIPHYDNAPGGIKQVAKEMADIDVDYGDIVSLHDNQCFIPSISALDVNTTDLFYNINQAIQQGTIQTPFDEYYLPTDNTFHVEITDGNPSSRGDNISFGSTKVYQGQAVNSAVLTGTYNYGEALSSQVTHTLVQNGGKLYLYNNSTDSYTGNTPVAGNTHTYYLGSGCKQSMLEIGDGGELIIGDASVDNKAIFIINDQSTIKIKSGGKITVNHGSTLLISEGANFIFEDGAQIALTDYGSILRIQGKFTVGNNADFTVTGLGRLVFDQNVKWAVNASGNYYLKLDEFWDIGQNATFKIIGPSNPVDYNHYLIEVFKPVYLKMENGNTFNEVRVENGRISLHQNALFFSFSPTVMKKLHFKSAYNWETHGGFRLWHNSGTNTFVDCHFKNGNPATLFHWVGGGNPVTLNACTFDDNIEGFRQDGGSFRLLGCDFTNNTYSVKGDNLIGNSIIANCDITGNNNQIDDGVLLSSQTGATVSVNKSNFNNNRAGFQSFNMDARVRCSDFTSNSFGGVINASGTLDVGGEAGNTFSENGVRDIYVTGDYQQTNFFIDNGHNIFSARGENEGVYLRGNILNGLPQFLNSSNELPADNNLMPTYVIGSTTYMPVDFEYKPVGSSYVSVSIDIPNNQATEDVCETRLELPSTDIAMHRKIYNQPEPGGMIEVPGVGSATLKEVALNAIEKMTYSDVERDDAEALADFIMILNAEVTDADNSTDVILDAVYHQMLIAINNCYQYGRLEHYGGITSPDINASVLGVIDIIDNLLEGLDPDDTEDQSIIFSKNLDKVHVYRLAGCYDNAITYTRSGEFSFDDEQGKQVSYWDCVCTNEDDYYKGKISQESYFDKISACQEYYIGNNFNKTGTISAWGDNSKSVGYEVKDNATKTVEYKLYPQPATNKLYISTNAEYDNLVSYKIIDPLGKVVKASSFKWQGNPEGIDISGLESGVYIIHFEGIQQTFKFIKL